MVAAANNDEGPVDDAPFPTEMLQAFVGPGMAVKDEPEFVEWKTPLSDETKSSPAVKGLAAMRTGEVELPSVAVCLNVAPPSVEVKKEEPDAA